MPFNLQVPDLVPQLTMQGMAALGAGIQDAGGAIGDMLRKMKKEDDEKQFHKSLLDALGMSGPSAAVNSGGFGGGSDPFSGLGGPRQQQSSPSELWNSYWGNEPTGGQDYAV